MVNRGRSAGCLTCRQRRVKCDEAKPGCRACTRLGIQCEGYSRPTRYARLKFRDENHKFGSSGSKKIVTSHAKASEVPTTTSRSPVPCSGESPLRLRRLPEPDTATLFYLDNYANVGRDMGSTRGFFELLIPMYFAQPQDSPLALAVSALASEVLSMWLHDVSSFRTPRQSYTRAITRLRAATKNPTERRQPATLLAVLVLQMYENTSAVFDLRRASSVHHDGAASLISYLDTDDADVIVRAYLRKFMLHTEVSTALRQRKPVNNVAYSYPRSQYIPDVPDNPSAALDVIGVSVAEIQSKYVQVMSHDLPMSPCVLEAWKVELQNVNARLLAWSKSVPEHCRPSSLSSGRDCDSSIPSFQSTCDIYPSCQIASIWNLWRSHRILVLKIMLSPFCSASYPEQIDSTGETMLDLNTERMHCQETLQEMIDRICDSIPFYLGNRTTRSSLADFTDPSILLPVDFTLKDTALPDNYHLSTGIPAADHRRHIIAQGPWRAMHPLSSLLTLFSEDSDGVITRLLRPGQRDWIREQFSRVATLLHLPRRADDCVAEPSLLENGTLNEAEVLARNIRKGAILMSGP